MKHAELIRAALDGKEIQYKSKADGSWVSYYNPTNAIVNMAREYDYDYRIKPIPKPDVVLYENVYVDGLSPTHFYCGGRIDTLEEAIRHSKRRGMACLGTIKITKNGETGELSVEVVKL